MGSVGLISATTAIASVPDVVTTNGTSHVISGATNGTRCYRVQTTYLLSGQQVASPFSNVVSATTSRVVVTPTCLEDDDATLSYSNGWHTVSSANASAGHFRVSSGNDSQHGASLSFDVPSGSTGKVTYYYAKSTKGGTADVYIDGAFKGTINYKGNVGSLKNPEFNANYKAEFGSLPAGPHILEIRMPRDGVYVDRFCLENSSSTGAPTAGSPWSFSIEN